eukprot:Skav203204  [mRNA]  locus=scaffold1148:50533:50919:- [translate_table: standard]
MSSASSISSGRIQQCATRSRLSQNERHTLALSAPLAALVAMATDVLDVLEDAIALDEIQAAAEAPHRNGQEVKKNWKNPSEDRAEIMSKSCRKVSAKLNSALGDASLMASKAFMKAKLPSLRMHLEIS